MVKKYLYFTYFFVDISVVSNPVEKGTCKTCSCDVKQVKKCNKSMKRNILRISYYIVIDLTKSECNAS